MSEPTKANAPPSPILWRSPAAGFLAQRPAGKQGLPPQMLPTPIGTQVHIWAASLDVPSAGRLEFEKSLSAPELERAARFRFDRHRNRYIVAHGWLRQLLAGYVGLPAAQLEFCQGRHGKPALAGVSQASELQFNLTHSEELVLVAIAHGTPVGIDVERVRRLEDPGELVTRFFSKREKELFGALLEADQAVAFFNLWTRKEAWLKATGEGITQLLDGVEVSFVPGRPARLLGLPQGFPALSNWSLFDLQPAVGFVGACVLAAGGGKTECHCCNETLFGRLL